jgi:lipopolysaccharide export system protein LptC
MTKATLYCSIAACLTAAVMLLVGTPPVRAQQDGMTLQGFKTRERKTDGSMAWELSGQEAYVKGATIYVTAARLLLYGEDESAPTVVTSPHCEFNQDTRIVHSNDHIEVEGNSFTIEGRGYDFIAATRRLTIHNEVCMVLQGKGVLDLPQGPGQNERDRQADSETAAPQ